MSLPCASSARRKISDRTSRQKAACTAGLSGRAAPKPSGILATRSEVQAISTARCKSESSARAACVTPLGAQAVTLGAKQDPLPRRANGQQLEEVVVVASAELRQPAQIRAPRRP